MQRSALLQVGAVEGAQKMCTEACVLSRWMQWRAFSKRRCCGGGPQALASSLLSADGPAQAPRSSQPVHAAALRCAALQAFDEGGGEEDAAGGAFGGVLKKRGGRQQAGAAAGAESGSEDEGEGEDGEWCVVVVVCMWS